MKHACQISEKIMNNWGLMSYEISKLKKKVGIKTRIPKTKKQIGRETMNVKAKQTFKNCTREIACREEEIQLETSAESGDRQMFCFQEISISFGFF